MMNKASVRVVGDAFSGTWANIRGDTGSWVRLNIFADGETWAIRAWADADLQAERHWHEAVVLYANVPDHMPGPFAPRPAVTLHLLANDVCDTEMRYGFASWDHKFADEHLTLRLEGNLLFAESYVLFKDDSGRSNCYVKDTFAKEAQPVEPGAVNNSH